MAKSWSTLIALCCLFTVSLALSQPENNDIKPAVMLPQNDAEPINAETESLTTHPLPKSDADPTLRLPSEPVNNEIESKSDAVTSVPLTAVTFRMVNRRFHARSKHDCRHRFGKLFPSLREPMEIPYGNDMMVSSGENSDFVDPMVHGGEQRKLDRPVRLHHHHHHSDKDEDSDSDDEDDDWIEKMVEKKLKMLKKIRKHLRHQHEGEETHKEGGFMVRVRKFLEEGGFMVRVRKFLGQYF